MGRADGFWISFAWRDSNYASVYYGHGAESVDRNAVENWISTHHGFGMCEETRWKIGTGLCREGMKMKRIGFRVDANAEIASGHLMRCISISVQCRKLGADVVFLMAQENGVELLQKQNLEYDILHSDWKNWDADIPLMENKIKQWNIGCLVVDSYNITSCYLSAVNAMTKVLYIDDMCREPYDVTYLMKVLYWDDENYVNRMYEGTDVKLLLGLKYVLLREEFAKREILPERKKQIVVTTGGTDPYHVTLNFAKRFISEKELEDYTLLLILGGMNADCEEIVRLVGDYNRIEVRTNINNMAEVLAESAYVILAGGNTMYEACACVTPSVVFSFADNQVKSCRDFDERGIMLYAGDARNEDDISGKIMESLKKLVSDEGYRNRCREQMQRLVDGKGAMRIARVLCMDESVEWVEMQRNNP